MLSYSTQVLATRSIPPLAKVHWRDENELVHSSAPRNQTDDHGLVH
jgi:hypothetical protein